MTLEETTQLYASVLRQLLPTGGYDTSPSTEALAVDVYAHAKLLAQADLDGKRLLKVLEELPPELLPEYELEYGLPLKCTVNASRTIEERLQILKWVRSTRNVLNRAYFDQVLKIFGVELFEFRKHTPMQCTTPCNAPVNTEQLRYKIRIVIPATAPADMDCIIENYFPGYLRIDVLKVPMTFQTSRPYAVEHIEALSSGFNANDDVVNRTILNEAAVSEELLSSFTVDDAFIRTTLFTLPTQPEELSSSFVVGDVQITKQITYLNYNVGYEELSSSFVIGDAQITKTVAYLSTTMETEALSSSFTVSDAVLTQT